MCIRDRSTGDRILSHAPAQTDIFEVNPNNTSNGEWAGTISINGGLNSSKMYRIRVEQGQTLNLKGEAVDVDKFSFEIQENWNWLPYPIARNVDVNEALATFVAGEGDLIKSQDRFAIYDPDLGWRGTLTSLRSGEGYLIRATHAQNFKYPGSLVLSSSVFNDPLASNNESVSLTVDSTFNIDFAQFSTNMNAIIEIPDEFTTIYAYDDEGNLRGQASIEDAPGNSMHFMTLYGNTGDTIHFKLANGTQTVEVERTVTYTADRLLGTLENPLQLIPEETTGVPEGFQVYPNPFKSELSVDLLAMQEQQIVVFIYDVKAQVVFKKTVEVQQGANSINIYLHSF